MRAQYLRYTQFNRINFHFVESKCQCHKHLTHAISASARTTNAFVQFVCKFVRQSRLNQNAVDGCQVYFVQRALAALAGGDAEKYGKTSFYGGAHIWIRCVILCKWLSSFISCRNAARFTSKWILFTFIVQFTHEMDTEMGKNDAFQLLLAHFVHCPWATYDSHTNASHYGHIFFVPLRNSRNKLILFLHFTRFVCVPALLLSKMEMAKR